MLMSMDPSAMNRPTAKSSESPGRIGKSSPRSMNTIAALTQKNWPPKRSSSHWGSIQSGPRECITRPRVCRGVAFARIPGREPSGHAASVAVERPGGVVRPSGAVQEQMPSGVGSTRQPPWCLNRWCDVQRHTRLAASVGPAGRE